MADGSGFDISGSGGMDAFNYIHQTIAPGDWVAYATVTAAPSSGRAGLMVASGSKVQPTLMANFVVSVNPGNGIGSEGRDTDGTNTFDFGETDAASDPNATPAGTEPKPPVTLKIRKVGGNFAGFYSTDGGKTQHFVGILALGLDPTAPVWLGLATTSLADGTLDSATYQNFVFAPLAAAAPAAGQ